MSSMWDGSIPCHAYDGPKVVYIEIPKAGSSSMKHALSVFRGGPPGPEEDPNRWTSYTWATDLGHLRHWFETRWRDYFKLTVVRHPLRRFEAFYYGRGPLVRWTTDINRYVAHQFELDAWRFDIHVIPQTMIIGENLGLFDFVGRLEDAAATEAVLTERTGQPIEIPHLNPSTQEDRIPMTAVTVKHLTQVFRRDFQLLGYDA